MCLDQLIKKSIFRFQDKLEASLNEALEKLDGEEHTVGVFQEKQKQANARIEELTAKGDEMSENISRVSPRGK